MRRGGDANSSAAQPDVGTSLSGLSFIKILFRACRERRERAACERALAAVFTPLSTHSRHPLVGPHTLVRARRGAASSRGHTVLLFIFLFSFTHTHVSRQVPFVSVGLSVHSFARFSNPIRRQQEEKRAKKTEETSRRHWKTRLLLKCVRKDAEREEWVFLVRDYVRCRLVRSFVRSLVLSQIRRRSVLVRSGRERTSELGFEETTSNVAAE